jgi:hypothetical protein
MRAASFAFASAFALAACSPSPETLLGQVGAISLRQADLTARMRFMKADDQISPSPEDAAFRQLVDAAYRAEILGRYGRLATRDVLRAEDARIQKTTLAPEKLAAYRKLFPTEDLWLDDYVRPVWVGRESYFGLFAADLRFQTRPAVVVREFAERNAGKKWPEVYFQAQRENLEARRHLLVRAPIGFWEQRPLLPPGTPDHPTPPASAQGLTDHAVLSRVPNAELVRRLLALKPGAFTDPAIDDTWVSVARVGAKSTHEITVEIFGAPLGDFSAWLNQEAAAFPLRCSSPICERLTRSLRAQPLF